MITQLQGKLVEKNPTHVVIDCHGVGYFVNISLNNTSLSNIFLIVLEFNQIVKTIYRELGFEIVQNIEPSE